MKTIAIVLMAVGVLLFLTGYLFKKMHWPDLFKGMYSGSALWILGFILIIVSIVRNSDKKKNEV